MAINEQQIAENIKQEMSNNNYNLHVLHEKTGIAYNTLKTRTRTGRGILVYELGEIAKALKTTPLALMSDNTSERAK